MSPCRSLTMFVLFIGVVGHPATSFAQACASDADCDDHNACTVDLCMGGVCQFDAIPGCGTCASDADCDDGNACTVDACVAGSCSSSPVDGMPCDDGNVCTTNDVCTNGGCAGNSVPGCGACASDADCDDQNACTVDLCMGGVCQFDAIPGCGACASDTDCDDGEPCTVDYCISGGCVYKPMGRDECATQGPTVPAASTWGLLIMATLLIAAGATLTAKRRGVHGARG